MNKDMITKDNTITKLLRHLSDFKDAKIVLKGGGTSLTKGYKMGERMSEDADMVFFIEKDSTRNKLKSASYKIREIIQDNFTITTENPKGAGGTHYTAKLIDGEVEIKLDIRTSKEIVSNSKVDVFEFNNDSQLVKTDVRFRVADLLDTFYDKIFAFQNNAYTSLVRHQTKKGVKIQSTEVALSNITKFKIKRLARHVYDLTKIFSKEFIAIEIMKNKIRKEKTSHTVSFPGKDYLQKTYEKKLNTFIIFNHEKEIKKWLKNISDDFTIDLNIDDVLKEINKIKKYIQDVYRKDKSIK